MKKVFKRLFAIFWKHLKAKRRILQLFKPPPNIFCSKNSKKLETNQNQFTNFLSNNSLSAVIKKSFNLNFHVQLNRHFQLPTSIFNYTFNTLQELPFRPFNHLLRTNNLYCLLTLNHLRVHYSLNQKNPKKKLKV